MKEKYLRIGAYFLYLLLILLALLFVLPRLLDFFKPFVIGFILSFITYPLAKKLETVIHLKRKHSSAIIVVIALALVVLALYGIGVLLFSGISHFVAQMPEMIQEADSEISLAVAALETMLAKTPLANVFNLNELSETINTGVSSLLTAITSSISNIDIWSKLKNVPNVLVATVTCLLSLYFFTADRDSIKERIVKHLPLSFRESLAYLYHQSLGTIIVYFKVQLKIMLPVWLILFIGLLILRVPYAWLWSFLIAFLDMLPVFGTGTVLVPWALIKLLSGQFTVAIGMIILYIICLVLHQLLQPKLIGDSVGLNPFAALIYMYIGYRFYGVIGMIIAIPLGMFIVNLYSIGVFDNFLWCLKEIVSDFKKLKDEE